VATNNQINKCRKQQEKLKKKKEKLESGMTRLQLCHWWIESMGTNNCM